MTGQYSGFGGLASGTRIVREGGRVKFDGAWFRDDMLAAFVGERVRVTATDPWVNRCVDVSYYPLGTLICSAEAEPSEDVLD